MSSASIIERLIDSEEHAVADAVPPVAEEAAETLQAAASALRIAKALIAEAMTVHIYNQDNGETPGPLCQFATGLTIIGNSLLLIEVHTDCDECGASIPDSYPSEVNAYHASSCSLHPYSTEKRPTLPSGFHTHAEG